MKLSKNAIRKFRRYGIVPTAVKEFQNEEEWAFKVCDRYGDKIYQYSALAPKESPERIGDMSLVREHSGHYLITRIKRARRYTGMNTKV